jgi:hypothetical protein
VVEKTKAWEEINGAEVTRGTVVVFNGCRVTETVFNTASEDTATVVNTSGATLGRMRTTLGEVEIVDLGATVTKVIPAVTPQEPPGRHP